MKLRLATLALLALTGCISPQPDDARLDAMQAKIDRLRENVGSLWEEHYALELEFMEHVACSPDVAAGIADIRREYLEGIGCGLCSQGDIPELPPLEMVAPGFGVRRCDD